MQAEWRIEPAQRDAKGWTVCMHDSSCMHVFMQSQCPMLMTVAHLPVCRSVFISRRARAVELHQLQGVEFVA